MLRCILLDCSFSYSYVYHILLGNRGNHRVETMCGIWGVFGYTTSCDQHVSHPWQQNQCDVTPEKMIQNFFTVWHRGPCMYRVQNVPRIPNSIIGKIKCSFENKIIFYIWSRRHPHDAPINRGEPA